ncbi:uracil-DNA glycosylase-like protein [Crepidotus variabilis]|uniref:Uracil-DNA glycosylase-like protein n=1 Tax=Crepidotus variabilis TaxID=179855 RepID=A0A9P6JIE7_9AGAR|nr:uracil-DNA glycosylase-like protein [Crepidotus variabilis]
MSPDEEVEEEIDDDEEELTKSNTSQFANRLARFAFVSPISPSKSTYKSGVEVPSKKKIITMDNTILLSSSSNVSAKSSALKSPNKRSITHLTDASPSKSSKKVKIYNHLNDISDHLDFGLDIIFCGINPGEQSSRIGHHYANPTNHFWSCLHESGLTSRKLDPRQDSSLPKDFRYGLTNLVSRPTVEVSGVAVLLAKIRQYKPLIVCFVGLGIADIFKSATISKPGTRRGQKKTMNEPASVGLQSYKMIHKGDQKIQEASVSREDTKTAPTNGLNSNETVFFAVSSTSGRVVRYQKKDKIRQFINLKDTLAQVKAGMIDTDELTDLP